MENSPKPIYLIDDFEFVPARFLLIDHRPEKGGQERKLEPKQSKILELFAQHQGEIVSREVLEREVWAGTIVSEQAVNNKISELRKLFGDNYKAPKYLKTHPQLGYELIAPISLLNEVKPEPAEPDQYSLAPVSTEHLPIKSSYHAAFFYLICIAMVVGGGFYLYKVLENTHQHEKKAVSLSPVTVEKGQEFSLNVRRDGQLTYSYRPLGAENWRIKIKSADGMKERYITDENEDSNSPVWLGNTDVIFYIKNIGNSCSIWRADDVWQKNVHKRLAGCGNLASITPLSVGDKQEWLYFSRFNGQSKFELARLNIETLNAETLVAPPSASFGDYSSTISPDGKKLAFLRASSYSQVDIMVLELATGAIKHILTVTHNIYRTSWDNSSETLYYIDQDNRLVAQNTEDGEITLLASLQQKSLAPYLDYDGVPYIVEGDFHVADIWEGDVSTEQYQEIVASSYQDYGVEVSGETTLFTSNRSGLPQIWLKSKGAPTQLTSFKRYSAIKDKHLNTDLNVLFFIQDNELYRLGIDSQKLVKLTPAGWRVESLVSDCKTGESLFTAKSNGIWSLYRFDNAAQRPIKVLSDIYQISADCDFNKYYGQQFTGLGLVEISLYDQTTYKLSFAELAKITSIEWQVNNNRLYILDKNKLVSFDLLTNKLVLSHDFSDEFVVHTFDVDAGRQYFTAKRQTEMEIKKIIFN
ncbi:hypothetical protein DXX93_19880 [Thalassotalea euphylliae]|uniref:OmpR/PhoB-type domain-containing protein n=1 Tax=Thalassotalea euphylliae TaxID=1655234 RepID=A0A3E0TVA9_9GAMM|nr:winged helix-turn-helix domain-containing protein [Thalassotalea euphylliae]REL28601.1 hypothetical protein DXX93_19880 [Thalassotalea euphylliae]